MSMDCLGDESAAPPDIHADVRRRSEMDAHDRHVTIDYGHIAMHIAMLIFAIFFAVFICWLVLSKQNSKLYEADNVVCVSQPFAISCFERKAR
jgi:hypothetical protein